MLRTVMTKSLVP